MQAQIKGTGGGGAVSGLAQAIQPYLPSPDSGSNSGLGGTIGGLLSGN